jgi:transglutaminase-like putative cysteine protease
LYKPDQIRLEYDAAVTRNAAQAFEARTGNCLSLVIMTAALARELGLTVRFQSAFVDETWSRSGELYFRSGHVNITLGRRFMDAGSGRAPTEFTVDFLPASELRGLRTREID